MSILLGALAGCVLTVVSTSIVLCFVFWWLGFWPAVVAHGAANLLWMVTTLMVYRNSIQRLARAIIDGAHRSNRVLVGAVGVDSGLLWIGDPSYVLFETPASVGKDWGEFCDILKDRSHMPFGHDGVVTSTGVGDGLFAVYHLLDSKGRIDGVEIRLLGDELEELVPEEWAHADKLAEKLAEIEAAQRRAHGEDA